jgi:hypothetical protein
LCFRIFIFYSDRKQRDKRWNNEIFERWKYNDGGTRCRKRETDALALNQAETVRHRVYVMPFNFIKENRKFVSQISPLAFSVEEAETEQM